MVQEQQEKSQGICKARHENHHPFEVEKQVWLHITKERWKGCMEIGKVRKLYPHLLAE